MTVEVRIPSVFIPDGRSLRSERRDVRVGRTDCTDPTTQGRRCTPTWGKVVTKSVFSDTEPPSSNSYPECRLTSGLTTHSAGKRVAAATFP